VGQYYELAVIDVAKVLKVLHTPVVPFHEEYSCHETVSDENAYIGKVVFAEQAPK
jgi:hypothetical protein